MNKKTKPRKDIARLKYVCLERIENNKDYVIKEGVYFTIENDMSLCVSIGECEFNNYKYTEFQHFSQKFKELRLGCVDACRFEIYRPTVEEVIEMKKYEGWPDEKE